MTSARHWLEIRRQHHRSGREWGKKKLAYEVQKMKEAFYYFIRFEAEGTVPAEIESRVRIMDDMIRYLCVRQDRGINRKREAKYD